MPELPEVETTVKGLNSKVLNRAFVGLWTDTPKIIRLRQGYGGRSKETSDLKEFKKQLIGKRINKVWRRAKNIIFDLSDGYSLLVHQKMTGHLLVGNWQLASGNWQPVKRGPLGNSKNRFLHLIFFLDDGKMLALSDVIKFAKVELWKTKELLNSKEFKNLGPEPLDRSFTFKKFKEALKGKKARLRPASGTSARQRKIKQVLMDQNIIAGIGNIYSSEILWQAKIHPEKNVPSLSGKELKLLYMAIKKVLLLSIKLGGTSFSDYRKVDGSKGDFYTERKAYKREGQKCHRCGTKIKRIKFGGRSAFFCPACQNLDTND